LPVWRLKTVELLGDKNEQILQSLNNLLGQSIFSSSVSRSINKTRENLAVADFTCRRGLPATLRCTLTLRTSEVAWKTEGAVYLVDKHGVLFATQPSDQVQQLVIEDGAHQPVKLGSVVASPEIINQYKYLVELLTKKQLTVRTLLLSESLYQVTAVIERPGKNAIQGLFLLSGDAPAQVEALVAVLAAKGDSITERIDVRVPGYVYTK
jgi:cell division septal protein FtsQ